MPAYSLRRLAWVGPAATVAASLANGLFYEATKALGEQYLIPLEGNRSQLNSMPVLSPVTATLVPGLLATILFGLLVRFARQPVTVFLSVCITALLLSFGGPLYLPASALQTKLLLCGMHVIAAAIITAGILGLSHKDTKVP